MDNFDKVIEAITRGAKNLQCANIDFLKLAFEIWKECEYKQPSTEQLQAAEEYLDEKICEFEKHVEQHDNNKKDNENYFHGI